MNKLGQRMEAKLQHDFTAMSLHGSDGDSKVGGKLFIGFAFGQEADNFELARSYSGAELSRAW